MRRVAPSTLVHEEIGEILAGGVPPETNLLSALVQLGVRHVVQQGLEQEQADFVGRDRYERAPAPRGGATATRTPCFAPPRAGSGSGCPRSATRRFLSDFSPVPQLDGTRENTRR
jgi:hypothetical protein